MSTPVKWSEVENCLKKGDPTLLAFDSEEVLARTKKFGDLYEPVVKLKQKMPPLDALQSLDAGAAAKTTAKSPRQEKADTGSTAAKAKRTASRKPAAARKRG